MANLAVQFGHKNGQAGAAHEEETLEYIIPHVISRLQSAGHKVTYLDGALQSEPANYQHVFDGVLFCHCDSNGGGSTFSIGYWEEMHPGSRQLAEALRQTYSAETGIPFGGFNITVGELHYYGNRRINHAAKCCLIEFGFVSNPSQRAFLQANGRLVGYAAADAYIKFFGGVIPSPKRKEDEMQTWEYFNTTEVEKIDCYRNKADYWVTTDTEYGPSKNLVFTFQAKDGGEPIASAGQDLKVAGVQHDHNMQAILAQDKFKGLTGSYKLTVTCASPINISIREIPK